MEGGESKAAVGYRTVEKVTCLLEAPTPWGGRGGTTPGISQVWGLTRRNNARGWLKTFR